MPTKLGTDIRRLSGLTGVAVFATDLAGQRTDEFASDGVAGVLVALRARQQGSPMECDRAAVAARSFTRTGDLAWSRQVAGDWL
jgi:hypothetical protein